MSTAGMQVFGAPRIAMERRGDGSILLRSEEEHPERLLAARMDAGGEWAGVTYGEARAKADALAQAFLDLGLSAQRPIMVLSGNSVEHLLVTLGAYTAGVPVIPVSPAYS